MEGLSGGDVDSVSKGCNHQPLSVSEVLITVPEGGIGDTDLDIILVFVSVELKLGLPLESVSLDDLLVNKLDDNISVMGLDSDETHHFDSGGVVKTALHVTDQFGKTGDDFFLEVLHGLCVLGDAFEAVLSLVDPFDSVGEQSQLRHGVLDPLLALVSLRHE